MRVSRTSVDPLAAVPLNTTFDTVRTPYECIVIGSDPDAVGDGAAGAGVGAVVAQAPTRSRSATERTPRALRTSRLVGGGDRRRLLPEAYRHHAMDERRESD